MIITEITETSSQPQMPSASKKSKKSSPPAKENRLSELPDPLLHYILSFLNTQQVVRTCVLSKRWRYVWTCVPFLSFDFHSFDAAFHVDNSDKMELFTKFINRVLLRRNSSDIVKFRYKSCSRHQPDLASWICYAVQHRVQELDIDYRCYGLWREPVLLPDCESLRKIALRVSRDGDIKFSKPLGFRYLKSLCLDGFSDVGKIFPSCPSLKILILKTRTRRVVDTALNIRAPNLRSLEISDSLGGNFVDLIGYKINIFAPKLASFKFRGKTPVVCSVDGTLPCLDKVDVHLNFYYQSNELKKEIASNLIKMLNAFHSAKSMKLSKKTLEALSCDPDTLDKHPSAFPNLKFLKLGAELWCNGFNIPACVLTYLLNKSTSLKVCRERGTRVPGYQV